MVRPIIRFSVLFGLLVWLSIQGSMSSEPKNGIPSTPMQFTNQEPSKNLNLSPDFGKIPLYFVPNRGQVDERALFYAKASKYTLWLTEEGLVFDSTVRIKKETAEPERLSPRELNNPEDVKYDREVSRLIFVNAKRSRDVIPVDTTEHKVNYFIGQDQAKWRSNIPTSRGILYKELYPNIDLKVYGMERQIEYDFVVKPGGEVSDIGFEYKDVEKTRIDDEGNLIVDTEFGDIKHAKPVCYQVIGGERVEIEAEFLKIADNNYGFKVKGYDRNYELIIDPVVLVYSTYLGGSGEDRGFGIAVDSDGMAYVTGDTDSMNFPTQSPIQRTNAGDKDIFITKVNSSGNALIYSTYLGGSGADDQSRIAVDSEGMAYVTGRTASGNFPTKNAIQGGYGGRGDAFITKVNSSGNALIYSTYLGGSGEDIGGGIAADSEGAAYVTGSTDSFDFSTQNPIQGTKAGSDDVFIAKIDSLGTALIYSTYLGGSGADYGNGIAVDSEGMAYVAGETASIDFPTRDPIQGAFAGNADVFIAKVDSLGNALVYSTYLGGSLGDRGWGIAVDSEGAAYVTGDTFSIDFPTQNPIQGTYAGGYYDAFIAKINASGTALIYSTYLGGSGGDLGFVIGVDSEGAACVTGVTWSADFPTQNPIQGGFGGGEDIFITKVNSSGSALIYSTYLGGSGGERGWGIAVDSEGAAYVTGRTVSGNFPTKNAIQGNNLGGYDIFIAKLALSDIAPTTYSLTVAAGGGGTTDPSPGTYTYDVGTTAAIRAVPNSGYTFSGWSGDASGTTNPLKVTMYSDKSITAKFSSIASLTIAVGGGGTTNPSPGTYKYDVGTAVTIRALPDSGYTFSGWSGDASGTANPLAVTMDSDKSVKAGFAKIPSDDKGGGGGGGCFIATACYGTSMAEEVKILSAFRDRYLMIDPAGKAIVRFYEEYSPSVADFIRDKEEVKTIIRAYLKPIVWVISQAL